MDATEDVELMVFTVSYAATIIIKLTIAGSFLHWKTSRNRSKPWDYALFVSKKAIHSQNASVSKNQLPDVSSVENLMIIIQPFVRIASMTIKVAPSILEILLGKSIQLKSANLLLNHLKLRLFTETRRKYADDTK